MIFEVCSWSCYRCDELIQVISLNEEAIEEHREEDQDREKENEQQGEQEQHQEREEEISIELTNDNDGENDGGKEIVGEAIDLEAKGATAVPAERTG